MAKLLKELFEERRASEDFRRRDKAYAELQRVYDSEDAVAGGGDPSYRPNLQDQPRADEEAEEIVVNQTRRVVNHFSAIFAYPPRTMLMPILLKEEQERFAGSDDLTAYNNHVLTRSNIATLHPRNTHWLSLRGDCMFGVDWGLLGNWGSLGQLKRGVRIFIFDPAYCYPLLSMFDLGGVEDMLVALKITPELAKEMFGLSESQVDSRNDPRLFYYWTKTEFRVAVEDHELAQFGKRHDLGFCPFRWVFGDPSGRFAQADVREVPKLQRTFNEGLLLAIDAIRKQVDASWWYSSDQVKDIHPVPGQADPLGPDARVGRWEIAADPQIILGVMQYLEQSIQATTGVSPISMSGAAPQTSHVTGTAVRHQIEAAEQRAEVRKALLQGAYSRLAEYVLMVTRSQMQEQVIHFRAGDVMQRLTVDHIAQYVEAEAEYGGFLGLTPDQRVQIALQGLGRLWDDEYAVGSVLDLPGITPEAMRRRLRQYQVEQAKAQGAAQHALQESVQQGQEPSGGPGGAGTGQDASRDGPSLSRPQRPSPPSPQGLRNALALQTGARNGRNRVQP